MKCKFSVIHSRRHWLWFGFDIVPEIHEQLNQFFPVLFVFFDNAGQLFAQGCIVFRVFIKLDGYMISDGMFDFRCLGTIRFMFLNPLLEVSCQQINRGNLWIYTGRTNVLIYQSANLCTNARQV